MAILIKPASITPAQLLKKLKDLIDVEGIRTWEYIGNDFFYAANQYKDFAYFHAVPDATSGQLKFGLRTLKNPKKISRAHYGIFHGHLISELLTHMYPHFPVACGTSAKSDPDDFEWAV